MIQNIIGNIILSQNLILTTEEYFAKRKDDWRCSSHNGMVFVRGNPMDFERWASQGLPKWSYKNVLPYFKKLESWSGGENLYRGGSRSSKS